jgi:hypothetical protein
MWGKAFLDQARSDWHAYTEIQKISVAECHKLYYLRSASEKLSKAALLHSGTHTIDSVSHNHKIFVKFLQVSTRNPRLARVLSYKNEQLKSLIKSVLPLAERIENLVPQGNSSPNAEYPWQNHTGDILVPAIYKFSESNDLATTEGRNLLKLIRVILENFDGVYL